MGKYNSISIAPRPKLWGIRIDIYIFSCFQATVPHCLNKYSLRFTSAGSQYSRSRFYATRRLPTYLISCRILGYRRMPAVSHFPLSSSFGERPLPRGTVLALVFLVGVCSVYLYLVPTRLTDSRRRS